MSLMSFQELYVEENLFSTPPQPPHPPPNGQKQFRGKGLHFHPLYSCSLAKVEYIPFILDSFPRMIMSFLSETTVPKLALIADSN